MLVKVEAKTHTRTMQYRPGKDSLELSAADE